METNLTAPSQVRALLSRYKVAPNKRLGQNFLVDRNTLDALVHALAPQPQDLVIEVGAGIGTATRELAKAAGHVIAIEIDSGLVSVLKDTLAGLDNVTILHADFLKLDLPALIRERSAGGMTKVFANLPYYITSPIITRLVAIRQHLELATLMVQREVADRLLAKPGTADYSSLTVMVRFFMSLELVMRVSRKVFLPPPEVDSTALTMRPLPQTAVPVADEKAFLDVVHAAFGKRRKTLENALATSPEIGLSKALVTRALQQAGIDPMRRGETLDLDEFGRLADAVVEVSRE